MQDTPAPTSPTLRQQDHDFLDAVLRLNPRLAAFDCDGTLWSGDAGESFFRWEIERGLISKEIAQKVQARHADYRKGLVDEDTMCGEMVTLHAGLADADLAAAAKTFIKEKCPQLLPGHARTRPAAPRARLRNLGRFFEQPMGRSRRRPYFGIPPNASSRRSLYRKRKNRRPPSPRPQRPRQIRSSTGSRRPIPDAAFGNSKWDADMLVMAKAAFAVNPNSDLEQLARTNNWTIYFP